MLSAPKNDQRKSTKLLGRTFTLIQARKELAMGKSTIFYPCNFFMKLHCTCISLIIISIELWSGYSYLMWLIFTFMVTSVKRGMCWGPYSTCTRSLLFFKSMPKIISGIFFRSPGMSQSQSGNTTNIKAMTMTRLGISLGYVNYWCVFSSFEIHSIFSVRELAVDMMVSLCSV